MMWVSNYESPLFSLLFLKACSLHSSLSNQNWHSRSNRLLSTDQNHHSRSPSLKPNSHVALPLSRTWIIIRYRESLPSLSSLAEATCLEKLFFPLRGKCAFSYLEIWENCTGIFGMLAWISIRFGFVRVWYQHVWILWSVRLMI
jgi:hypothetical protein